MRYRTEEELVAIRSRDPLEIQGARLADPGRTAIDDEVERVLDKAVSFALDSPFPDPLTAMDHLYASGLTVRPGSEV
jgi:pyruvate dehydrogenase E1 component alpha subunit